MLKYYTFPLEELEQEIKILKTMLEHHIVVKLVRERADVMVYINEYDLAIAEKIFNLEDRENI